MLGASGVGSFGMPHAGGVVLMGGNNGDGGGSGGGPGGSNPANSTPLSSSALRLGLLQQLHPFPCHLKRKRMLSNPS